MSAFAARSSQTREKLSTFEKENIGSDKRKRDIQHVTGFRKEFNLIKFFLGEEQSWSGSKIQEHQHQEALEAEEGIFITPTKESKRAGYADASTIVTVADGSRLFAPLNELTPEQLKSAGRFDESTLLEALSNDLNLHEQV